MIQFINKKNKQKAKRIIFVAVDLSTQTDRQGIGLLTIIVMIYGIYEVKKKRLHHANRREQLKIITMNFNCLFVCK